MIRRMKRLSKLNGHRRARPRVVVLSWPHHPPFIVTVPAGTLRSGDVVEIRAPRRKMLAPAAITP